MPACREHLRRIAGVALAAMLALIAVLPAAAAVTVELTATPKEITLGAAAGQDIVLTARASPAGTFVEATLTPLAPPGLTTEVTAEPALDRGVTAWTIRLRADRGAAAKSTVTFRVDYRTENEASAGTAAATVAVTYEPAALAGALRTSLQKGFGLLEPGQAYTAILTIENTGAEDASLTSVTPRHAPGLVELAPPALPVAVPAHGTVALPVTVTVADRVVPGAMPLLLSLAFGSADGETATLTLTDSVTIGIPVLSDLSTVFQIPSLLFLPGVLIVLTATMFWGLAGRAAPALSPKSGEFYVVAVTASLILAWAYTWWIGAPFDFLRRVSITDIATLWFVSIVVGFLGFLIALGIATWREWRTTSATARAAAAKAAITPLETDGAGETIARLARVGKGLTTEMRSLSKGGVTQVICRLELGEPPEGKAWFVPRIVIDPRGPADATVRIDGFLTKDDAKGLAAYLAGAGKDCKVGWDAGALLTRPTVLEKDAGTDAGKQPLARRRP